MARQGKGCRGRQGRKKEWKEGRKEKLYWEMVSLFLIFVFWFVCSGCVRVCIYIIISKKKKNQTDRIFGSVLEVLVLVMGFYRMVVVVVVVVVLS